MKPIQSERLTLVSMTPLFLQTCLAGDRDEAGRLLGIRVPELWLHERELMQLRLDQMGADPTLEAWLLRAVVLRQEKPGGKEETEGTMIGHIGCHTAPGPDYLAEYAPEGVEIGYTIFEPYRRQGYASEAFRALMDWAHRAHQVPQFVVSISPQNVPSQRMAARFGFQQVDTVIDEEDGPEDVYVRRIGYA